MVDRLRPRLAIVGRFMTSTRGNLRVAYSEVYVSSPVICLNNAQFNKVIWVYLNKICCSLHLVPRMSRGTEIPSLLAKFVEEMQFCILPDCWTKRESCVPPFPEGVLISKKKKNSQFSYWLTLFEPPPPPMATSNNKTPVQMFLHHQLWLPELSMFKSHFLAVSKVICPPSSCPARSLAASPYLLSKHYIWSDSSTYPQKIYIISKLIYIP
jgi:hypothetical protein